MDLSFEEMKGIKAREIYGFLLRETLNALPADSPLRPYAKGLGFSGQRNRAEVSDRHRQGLHAVRHSSDVALAFGCVENGLPEQRMIGHSGTNTAAWHAQAEPTFQRASETFHGDRFVGILGLLENIFGLIQERYAPQGVPFPAMLQLAHASVAAYGYGFFVGYNAEHRNHRPSEAES